MEIFLVNAPVEFDHDPRMSTVPLGLLSIASYIKTRGFPSRIFNFACSTDAEIIDSLKGNRPDIIGISFYSDNRVPAYNLISLVRTLMPDSILVLGGHHATCMYQQLLEKDYADIVVLGEGEQTFLELVQKIKDHELYEDVDGIAFKKNGKVVTTKRRKLIDDLDSLYSFDDNYVNFDTADHSITKREAKYIAGSEFGPKPWEYTHYSLITTRGCPYSCGFCASKSLAKKAKNYWRAASPEYVVDAVEHLHKNYNCRYVSFYDNSPNIIPGRLMEICKQMIERKLNVKWWMSMRPDTKYNPEEMIILMKKAGCWRINYGVESGSQKILDIMRKQTKVEEIIETFEKVRRAGISTIMKLIVGYPGETKETVYQTLKLIEKCKPTWIQVSLPRIYPNTDLGNIASEKMIINDSVWLKDMPYFLYYPEHSFRKTSYWFALERYHLNTFKTLLIITYMLKTVVRETTGINITSKGLVRVNKTPPFFK